MATTVRWGRVAAMLAAVLLLAALWPNLVHEPLHWLALRLQGSDGTISFDWSVPAHPSTTRTMPVAGVAGGLLFFLLPSAVSVGILAVLWHTRRHATVITHFLLPAYLGADVMWNIVLPSPISDFRFLHALWPALALPLAGAIGIATCAVLWTARRKVADAAGVQG